MVQTTQGRAEAESQGGLGEASIATLVTRLSEQVSTLAKDEIRLARAEMESKAKKVGVGAGLMGAAGALALYGLGGLLLTVGLALALAMPDWLAALIVSVVVLAAAGVLALAGKSRVRKGTPPVPEEAIRSVQRDVETVKESARR